MVADGSQNGAVDNIVKSGFGEFWSPGRISVAFRRWAMGRGRGLGLGLGLGRAWAGPGRLLGWRHLGLGGAGRDIFVKKTECLLFCSGIF